MLQFLRPAPKARLADPRLAEPTPTLRLLAGEHAGRVAHAWPAPHGVYLEMPAQRRHLAHVVLQVGIGVHAEMVDALTGARADALARRFLGPLPTGFVKALGRLGELPWTGIDYLRLLELFETEDAAAVLRQTLAITPDAIQALGALAPALRVVAVARHVATPAQAVLLDEAWRGIVAVRGPGAGRTALARWARATDTGRLVEMAAEDLAPQRFDLAAFPVHEDFRRLGGVIALEDAGRRFRNCLATYRDLAADGAMALYEWAGPPPAAFALRRDGFFGWRLEEARGVENTLLDADARLRLTAILEALGVRVGPSGRTLGERLKRAGGKEHGWIDDNETAMSAFEL